MYSLALMPFRNAILAALPPDEIAQLRPHLIRTALVLNQPLQESGERIDQVYFFEQGFASIVAVADGESNGVEVGMVGSETMLGLSVMLNPDTVAFNRAMVQYPGVAYRVATAVLLDLVGSMPTFRSLLLLAIEGYMAQVAQTAACNSRHTLPERCARWLLTAHDRVDGDELRLTQEFLSMMLAVRRSGVTVALQSLQGANLVHAGRGRITICDRPGLEAAACGCYQRVKGFIASLQ